MARYDNIWNMSINAAAFLIVVCLCVEPISVNAADDNNNGKTKYILLTNT